MLGLKNRNFCLLSHCVLELSYSFVRILLSIIILSLKVRYCIRANYLGELYKLYLYLGMKFYAQSFRAGHLCFSISNKKVSNRFAGCHRQKFIMIASRRKFLHKLDSICSKVATNSISSSHELNKTRQKYTSITFHVRTIIK